MGNFKKPEKIWTWIDVSGAASASTAASQHTLDNRVADIFGSRKLVFVGIELLFGEIELLRHLDQQIDIAISDMVNFDLLAEVVVEGLRGSQLIAQALQLVMQLSDLQRRLYKFFEILKF